jgi:hypothetical protein
MDILKLLTACSSGVLYPDELREQKWWAVLGSNQRPLACKANALPTELTAHRQIMNL